MKYWIRKWVGLYQEIYTPSPGNQSGPDLWQDSAYFGKISLILRQVNLCNLGLST